MVVLPQRETFSCLFLREGEEGEERGKGGDGALDLRGAGIQRSVGWPEVRQSGGAVSAVLARGRRFRAVPALCSTGPLVVMMETVQGWFSGLACCSNLMAGGPPPAHAWRSAWRACAPFCAGSACAGEDAAPRTRQSCSVERMPPLVG